MKKIAQLFLIIHLLFMLQNKSKERKIQQTKQRKITSRSIFLGLNADVFQTS